MSYSFFDLAIDVLTTSAKPLTYQEIWEVGKTNGLTEKIQTAGLTPWQTLGARLYVDVRDNEKSHFIKVGKRPARFFLKSRELEIKSDTISIIEKEELAKPGKKTSFHERALHPLLTYFVYANPAFNRGKSIFTKTIFHEKSTKSGYNEWIHPDIVGFYLPLDDWRPSVIEFNRLSDNDSLKLFSFELKKSLNKANYREAYFQAVSNSSWAHEGWLVAPNILQDDDFLSELERLVSSFGIGIIQLNLEDIDSSKILYPAKTKASLDWETINKLCEQNPDFNKFLEDVKIDFESKRIHKTEYDEVLKDVDTYILNKINGL
ncbi:MAG: HTH domain-containing protein [Gallionella sp.]|nr:HTH domain-containing protein [Gallionella sp.]